jgi:hypothetical protein
VGLEVLDGGVGLAFWSFSTWSCWDGVPVPSPTFPSKAILKELAPIGE